MDLDGFIAGYRSGNVLIASVNPADLRSVEAVQRDVRSRFPGKQVIMDDDAWKRACSPRADLFAMFYRIAFLEMLADQGLLSSWLHNGELDDAVFKVFGTFPLKRIQRGRSGRSQEGFPFDVEELMKQIEKEANAEET